MFRPLALSLVLATPAAAQQDPCASADWIGGSEAASDVATMAAPAEQMALVLTGAQHASQFRLSAPAATRIEAQGRGNGDPVMVIYDDTGAEIASDDDSGGNGAARAELDLAPGRYCAVVRSFDDRPMTAFVRVGRTEMAPLTTPEAPAPATDGTTGCDGAPDLGPLDGSGALTAEATPEARLAFTLEQPQGVTVTARNQAADPALSLADTDGRVLAENDDFDGLNARIDLPEALPAGHYCLTITALGEAGQPVEIAVARHDPEAAMQALFDRGESAPPLDGSVAITELGPLDGRLRRDLAVGEAAMWLSFEVTRPGALIAEALAMGPSGDPWLALYDEAGRSLGQNDDGAQTTDAMLAARVQPGRYLLAVKQVAGGTGYLRLLLEGFVAAD